MEGGLREARLRVEGRVHGVGYRAFCLSLATELGLTGYASNMPDSSVEVLVQGPADKVGEFVARLRSEAGPGMVSAVEVTGERKIKDSERLERFEQRWG